MKQKQPIITAIEYGRLHQQRQKFFSLKNSFDQTFDVVGRNHNHHFLVNWKQPTTTTTTNHYHCCNHQSCLKFSTFSLGQSSSSTTPLSPKDLNSNFLLRIIANQQIMSNQKKKISSDLDAFQDQFNRASKIVVLTGAGISAESGIPTFRGEGGFWRSHKCEKLATPEAFAENPSLVWQFYEYRRQLVQSKEPNLAHKSLTLLESKFIRDSPQRQVIVVTQNVDELHKRAGMKRVLELHGSLFKTRCTQCNLVKVNYKNPICPALEKIELDEPDRNIDPKDLPRCDKCSGLLRPHVVWFGEQLDPFVLKQAEGLMSVTDFLLVVGTSSVVYPAASLVPQAANRGVVVSEFNIEQTAASDYAKFFFKGPCAQTLPKALGVGDEAIISWGTQ